MSGRATVKKGLIENKRAEQLLMSARTQLVKGRFDLAIDAAERARNIMLILDGQVAQPKRWANWTETQLAFDLPESEERGA